MYTGLQSLAQRASVSEAIRERTKSTNVSPGHEVVLFFSIMRGWIVVEGGPRA